MARIAGVDIPREKRVEIALTYIYGIGNTVAKQVLASTDVDPDTRVRDLTDEEVSRLRYRERPDANSPRKRAPANADTSENSYPSRKAGTSQIPIRAPIQYAAHSRIPRINPLAAMSSVCLDPFRKHNAPAEYL